MHPAARPIQYLAVITLVILACATSTAVAKEAPSTRPNSPSRASSIFDLTHMDVNNLDMFLTNYGSFAYDHTTAGAGLIYPKGTGKTTIFAAGPWIGAIVNGEVRVATAEYGSEYTPGPMVGGTFQPDQFAFRNYRIDGSGSGFGDYLAYAVPQGAPTDGHGNPLLFGDVTIWSVYNDADFTLHGNLGGHTTPLGIEIQQTTFAFNRSGALGNTIFLKFRIANKGTSHLEQAYFGCWSDPDLGGYSDDLVGCDTLRSLGFAYNATNQDAVYGALPPAVGFTLLQGPRVPGDGGAFDTLGTYAFAKYINGTDPTSGIESYNRLRGLDLSGNPIHVMDNPQLPVTTYEVSGDPVSGTGWLDTNSGDRRMLLSVGPFNMEPGDVQEVVFALIVGQGSDRLSSITALRSTTGLIQSVWPIAPTEPPPVLNVTLDLDPNVINTAARAAWLSAYVEPVGFDVTEIDPSSVRLAGSIAPVPGMAVIGDHDLDGAPDLALKFSRSDLLSQLGTGDHEVTLTGSLFDGSQFRGSDALKIITPPAPHAPPTVAPNPLNPSGTLTFHTRTEGAARVTLWDVQGRFVRTVLPLAPLAAGRHDVEIGSQDGRGAPLSSGIYFARIEAAGEIETARVVILK